jgi:hypothetical protein
MPHRLEDSGTQLAGRFGQLDLGRVPQSLDEIARPELLCGKNKRFLFYCGNDLTYRHYAPDVAAFERGQPASVLEAKFRCYEDYARAKKRLLRFKIENVARSEQFAVTLNGRRIKQRDQAVLYASNGRDTRIHTVRLEPYLYYEIPLKPEQLVRGGNSLEITPTRLLAGLSGRVRLVEIEFVVDYG